MRNSAILRTKLLLFDILPRISPWTRHVPLWEVEPNRSVQVFNDSLLSACTSWGVLFLVNYDSFLNRDETPNKMLFSKAKPLRTGHQRVFVVSPFKLGRALPRKLRLLSE